MPNGIEQKIDQALTCLDVTADDRGSLGRVVGKIGIEKAWGKGDFNVLKQPLVQRNWFID